jgi:hypothetical protein
MIDIKTIYAGAEALITQILRKESSAQGHYLTGAMEGSFEGVSGKEGQADVLNGFAVAYTQYVNEGVPAKSASFRQAPFLIRYFRQRGLPEKEATAAAFATIKVWMKEGMSTQASKRFSQTGSRQHFVEHAITGNEDKIDAYMLNSFDFAVDEAYHKEKSETI